MSRRPSRGGQEQAAARRTSSQSEQEQSSAQQERVLEAKFYRTPAGNEPVYDWLRGLDRADKKIVGEDIRTIEVGWPVGMPISRSLGDGLYEVRSTIKEGKVEARTYYAIIGSDMLLIHYQEGKSGQESEISFARDRLSNHKERIATKRKVKDKLNKG